MNYRILGKTGFSISEISLGTWQVGGKWGSAFDHENAEKILRTAIDQGINFIDTADIYSGGLSEAAVGKVVRESGEEIYVATKCGRKIHPHISEGYQPQVLREFVDTSLKNSGLERLDIVQLHCPPTEVYYRPEIFETFAQLKQEGKIGFLGVSVEKVEEALKAIEYPNVATVQIIFNMFRHRPSELFFKEAAKKDVGIIVRVPLASGLLTGNYSRSTSFGEEDHRNFNRQGARFDKGETFSGVDYETGLEAVEKLRTLFPGQDSLAPIALKWILHFEEVSCIIPGASRPEQVLSNVSAIERPDFTPKQWTGIKEIYETMVKPQVHHLW